MAKKSYEKAIEELQSILEDLQTDEVSVDDLAKKLKKANELLSYCKSRLRSVEEELEEAADEE